MNRTGAGEAFVLGYKRRGIEMRGVNHDDINFAAAKKMTHQRYPTLGDPSAPLATVAARLSRQASDPAV